jgi:hypothetical protein
MKQQLLKESITGFVLNSQSWNFGRNNFPEIFKPVLFIVMFQLKC